MDFIPGSALEVTELLPKTAGKIKKGSLCFVSDYLTSGVCRYKDDSFRYVVVTALFFRYGKEKKFRNERKTVILIVPSTSSYTSGHTDRDYIFNFRDRQDSIFIPGFSSTTKRKKNIPILAVKPCSVNLFEDYHIIGAWLRSIMLFSRFYSIMSNYTKEAIIASGNNTSNQFQTHAFKGIKAFLNTTVHKELFNEFIDKCVKHEHFGDMKSIYNFTGCDKDINSKKTMFLYELLTTFKHQLFRYFIAGIPQVGTSNGKAYFNGVFSSKTLLSLEKSQSSFIKKNLYTSFGSKSSSWSFLLNDAKKFLTKT